MRLALVSVLMLIAIIVPFLLWGEALEQWAAAYVRSEAGWWPVAAAIAALLASDIVLPVPSSLLATAAGALLGFTGGAAASWLGMTAGCLLGYALGSRTGGERLLGPSDLQRVRHAQQRFGDWMLIVFRAVPVLAEASVFFAGLSRMPWRRFAAITSISNLGISLAYSAAGAFFAGRESFLLVFAAAVALPGVAMIMSRQLNRP